MLGDLEPQRPLDLELASLIAREIPVWYIHGNHDADSAELWARVWGSEIADRNIPGRVVELPNGQQGRLRERHIYPPAEAAPMPAGSTTAPKKYERRCT